jgi:hypothetical protein
MIALRIRGLYAAALAQLFRHDGRWEIVQPSEEVRASIEHTWRMDSPDVDIDDVPDDNGQRHVLRLSGTANAVGDVLAHLQQHCFDVITHQEHSEVGALYMGLIGILSRARRQAVVYLGDTRVGILPLRYEDQGLQVGSYLPVRVEATAPDSANRLQVSKVLTIPGPYAVLTAVPAVRLSKQITDTAQRERLQRLGEAQATGDWGIIWRTAAQEASDADLVAEIQRLTVETQTLQGHLQNVKSVGRIRGGELTSYVFMPGHAKALCDTLRAAILPTLPGHHKYKARGDIYSITVDALEKELPAEILRSRTSTLSVLASINAMQQPIQATLHLLQRTPTGQLLDQGEVARIADDIHAGWVDVRQSLRHKTQYPRALQVSNRPGDYSVTRFDEGSWHYITQFYNRDSAWQGDYAGITTPIGIFSDHIYLVDLQVALVRSQQQTPTCIGMDALERLQQQGCVTAALVQRVQEESEAILQKWRQEGLPGVARADSAGASATTDTSR